MGVPLGLLTAPAETILLTGGAFHDSIGQSQLTDYGGSTGSGQANTGPTPASMTQNATGGSSANDSGGDVEHRQTDGLNILWYDGHVKKMVTAG